MSHDRDVTGPPTVVVAARPDAPATVRHEVCAGCEEQGVPYAVVEWADADPAAAAARSRLEVGVGIAADGAVTVHHALVPGPVLAVAAGASPAALRAVGGDAARIVTGLPLRTALPPPPPPDPRLLAGTARDASDTSQ